MQKNYKVNAVKYVDLKETKNGNKYISIGLSIGESEFYFKELWLPNDKGLKKSLIDKGEEPSEINIEDLKNKRLSFLVENVRALGFSGSSLEEMVDLQFYPNKLNGVTCTLREENYKNKEGMNITSQKVGWINVNQPMSEEDLIAKKEKTKQRKEVAQDELNKKGMNGLSKIIKSELKSTKVSTAINEDNFKDPVISDEDLTTDNEIPF